MCDNSTKAERERLRVNVQAFMAINSDNIRLNNANMGLKVRICKQKIDNLATKKTLTTLDAPELGTDEACQFRILREREGARLLRAGHVEGDGTRHDAVVVIAASGAV